MENTNKIKKDLQENKYTIDMCERIRKRMVAENATDLSDSEIERCLKNCVIGPKLVAIAKDFKKQGILSLDYNLTKKQKGVGIMRTAKNIIENLKEDEYTKQQIINAMCDGYYLGREKILQDVAEEVVELCKTSI